MLFFGIPKYGSVSVMLMRLNLPALHNARVAFHSRLKLSGNAVMNAIKLVGCIIYCVRFRVILTLCVCVLFSFKFLLCIVCVCVCA